MKDKLKKNNDMLFYSINTLNGLNKKCNIPLTVLLIITNILLSFYEDKIDCEFIYQFFTSFLFVELGLNIYDVINEINANSKLQKLQNSLMKRKININFLEEDVFKEGTIKYIDDEYIYKDNINITEDVKYIFGKRGK